MLWWWGIDNADKNGRLRDATGYEIAAAADWPIDDADRFVDALVNAGKPFGFLERRRNGEFVLHDWHKYAGKLVEKKEINAARMRDARAQERDARATHKPARAHQEERRGEERKEEETEERRSRQASPPRPPRQGGHSQDDWDFARNLYEAHVGPLDSRARDEMRRLFDKVPDPQWVFAAINQTKLAKEPGFGYFKNTLEDCINSGIAPSSLTSAGAR